MAQFVFKANITDGRGNPMIGLEVEAIDVNLFTTSLRDPIQHIVATATTDNSGTATFTGLAVGMYYARPRITRPDLRIQVMIPSGMGGGGKMCYAALVQPDGIGTHTTIQAAVTALGTGGGVIFICAGNYAESVTIAGSTDDLWLIGAARGEVTITGQSTDPTITVAAAAGGQNRLRFEHLTLTHAGAQTLLYFDSAAGALPGNVDILDIRFLSGSVGIDLSDSNGGTDFRLRDIVMESTVADAGQLEVIDLTITNCHFGVSGKGLYLGGGSAISHVRVNGCYFKGGDTQALRISNLTDLAMTGCEVVAIGEAAVGITINNNINIGISETLITCTDGIGINATGIIIGLTLEALRMRCAAYPVQTVPRVGIYISGFTNDVVIDGCRIYQFESFGVEFNTKSGAGQRFIVSDCIIENGGDTHSIEVGDWDYGTITGNVLIGTGGGNTTYGINGTGTPTYVVIVGNVAGGHDGLTNLVGGVNGNVVVGNSPAGPGGDAPNAAEYLVLTLHDGLSDERRLVAGTGLTGTDAGANDDYTLEHAADASAIPAAHHAKYLNSEAIAAVEGELTLDLLGEVTIASGKSLTLKTDGATGGLKLGAAGDVLLYRGAANKLYLATGDTLHLVSGNLEFAVASVISTAAGDLTLTPTGDVVITAGKTLKVDTIGEVTGAAGVTVDGVTLKDDAVEVDALRGLKESGGQSLDMGAVADGEYLKRSGTDIVGDTPAGNGGGTKIEDADTDTKVDVEEGADEDIVRMDVAGTERFHLKDSTPHLTLTGDSYLNGFVGAGVAPITTARLKVGGNYTSAAGGYAGLFGLNMTTSNNGATCYGLGGAVAQIHSGTLATTYGLGFGALAWKDGGSWSKLCAMFLQCQTVMEPTIAEIKFIEFQTIANLGGNRAIPTTITCIDIPDVAPAVAIVAPTTIYGLKIATFTQGTNRYLLEIGDDPLLRVDGAWAPEADETALYLGYDGGPALGQVTLGAADSGGAGFRALRLPN